MDKRAFAFSHSDAMEFTIIQSQLPRRVLNWPSRGIVFTRSHRRRRPCHRTSPANRVRTSWGILNGGDATRGQQQNGSHNLCNPNCKSAPFGFIRPIWPFFHTMSDSGWPCTHTSTDPCCWMNECWAKMHIYWPFVGVLFQANSTCCWLLNVFI